MALFMLFFIIIEHACATSLQKIFLGLDVETLASVDLATVTKYVEDPCGHGRQMPSVPEKDLLIFHGELAQERSNCTRGLAFSCRRIEVKSVPQNSSGEVTTLSGVHACMVRGSTSKV